MTGLANPFESITGMATRIRAGAVGPVALTEQHLERIEQLDERLHSFLLVTRERALDKARAAEIARRKGQDLGPLHGIPYAVKDLFDVAGMATTAGTHVLAGNIAEKDCAAVHRLAEAGMILLGKNHTIQLAYGTVGINSDQGTPHNPWNPVPHAPGGSSSGSAVAVAAGLVPVSLGTDTGGSVRIPAALCGIVGLKTTVGRISRFGVHPLSWSLDSFGPLTRTVEDAAQVYQVLQKDPDPRDASTDGVTPHDALLRLKEGVRGLKVGVGETLFFDGVDPEIEKAVRQAGEVFRSLGARVESVAVPEAAEAWAEEKRAYFIAAEACVLNHDLLEQHFDALDPLVAPRMIAGRSLSATDYFLLLRQYQALRGRVRSTLGSFDAFLVPTTMTTARRVDEVGGSLETYIDYHTRLHRNSGIGNILNLCAVSLPCGFTSEGFPIGLMIYAKPFDEDVALRVAYAYERATEWHARHPDLAWAESGPSVEPSPGVRARA